MELEIPIPECSTVEALLKRVHLVDVRLVELSGKLTTKSDSTQIDLGTRLRESRGFLFTEFQFQIDTKDSSTSVALSASWDSEEPIRVAPEALREFVSKVAFMTVYPYARESIARVQTALRGQVSTLDIVRPGTVEIELDGADFSAIADELIISRAYATHTEASAD